MLTLLIGAALVLCPGDFPPQVIGSHRTKGAASEAEAVVPAGGPPTAEQIHRAYLDGASAGVRVFSPDRIRTRRTLRGRWLPVVTTGRLERSADAWRASSVRPPACASRILRSLRCSREARSAAALW